MYMHIYKYIYLYIYIYMYINDIGNHEDILCMPNIEEPACITLYNIGVRF